MDSNMVGSDVRAVIVLLMQQKEQQPRNSIPASASFSPERDEQQELVMEAAPHIFCETVSHLDKACGTTLNLMSVLDDAKGTEHRLKVKIQRQQDALRSCSPSMTK